MSDLTKEQIKEYIKFYTRKTENYRNRMKWLRKQIQILNDKIFNYEECKLDFVNELRKRKIAALEPKAGEQEQTTADPAIEPKAA